MRNDKRPNPQTNEDYDRNLAALQCLINARYKSERIPELIQIRTRIAEDAIQAELNFLTHVTSQRVYDLCYKRVTERQRKLDMILHPIKELIPSEAGQILLLILPAFIFLILILIGILWVIGYTPTIPAFM